MAKIIRKSTSKITRIDIIDFWRFFAALMIMVSHFYKLGGKEHHLEFFVEFFFMIAGYFIFKHFQKPEYTKQSLDQKAKNALAYTWKRFLKLMPYVIPIVLFCSVAVFSINYANDHWLGNFINSLRNIINEFLLLPSGIMSHRRIIGPIWYLSVMIFIMPVICLIAQSKRQNLFVLIMCPILWFWLQYSADFTSLGVNSYLSVYRGVINMLVGGIIYFIVQLISSKKIKNSTRIFLTIIEPILYIYAALVGYFNLSNFSLIIVLLFFAATITLSQKSYSAKIQSKFFNFLGSISLPLFMWHYGILEIINALHPDISVQAKSIIMCVLAIIVSVVHELIVRYYFAHKKQSQIKKRI